MTLFVPSTCLTLPAPIHHDTTAAIVVATVSVKTTSQLANLSACLFQNKDHVSPLNSFEAKRMSDHVKKKAVFAKT